METDPSPAILCQILNIPLNTTNKPAANNLFIILYQIVSDDLHFQNSTNISIGWRDKFCHLPTCDNRRAGEVFISEAGYVIVIPWVVRLYVEIIHEL